MRLPAIRTCVCLSTVFAVALVPLGEAAGRGRKSSAGGAADKRGGEPRFLGTFTAKDVFLTLHPEASKDTYAAFHRRDRPADRTLTAAARMKSDGRIEAWDGTDPDPDGKLRDTHIESYRNIVVNENTMEIRSATWADGSRIFTTNLESIRLVEWKGGPDLLVASLRWNAFLEEHPPLIWEGADGWDEVALFSRKESGLVIEARTIRPIFAGAFSMGHRTPRAMPIALSSTEQGIMLREDLGYAGKFSCYLIETTLIVRRAGATLVPVLWTPTGFCNSRIDHLDDYWPDCAPCARSAAVTVAPTSPEGGRPDLVWSLKDKTARFRFRWDGAGYAPVERTMDEEMANALRCDLLLAGIIPMNQDSPPPEFRKCEL